FFHGLRFGGSRIIPAGMSIVPGGATPIAAISFSVLPEAAMAPRIVAHIWFRPCSRPLYASVGIDAGGDALPSSAPTAAFLDVPPTSTPTYNRGDLMARPALLDSKN